MTDRYFGPYRGIVADNKDPQGQMRIKARVPEVMGEQTTPWALPCLPPGVRAVPEVGTPVWVEFEAGDLSRPVWIGTLGIRDPIRRTRG